jgi:uncharacterized protein YndB with AHSA1/START domain
MSEPVVRSVNVDCTLHDAFVTFTARIDLWWPAAHRRFPESVMVLEPWTGGGFFEKTHDGQEVRLGEVLRFEPPHRLAYTWYPGAIQKPTLVEVSFVQENESVRVTVTHAEDKSALGVEWPKRAERFATSWDAVLPAFAQLLASEAKELDSPAL